VRSEPIDLQTAADRLGVHYQTAYRWVRSGQLKADLVQGHYLIDPADVTALAEQRSRPRPPRVRRPRLGFGPLGEQMFELLVDGDEREVGKLVGGLLAGGVPLTSVVQEVVVPALRRIGAEWDAGRLTIWAEHRASAIVERILGEHQPRPRGRRRGTAVVAALSGDRHGLPTSMAAAALREDNWKVDHLGADVPPDEVIAFCERNPVDIAVLTVTATATRDEAERTSARLEALGVRTLVGRPGATLAEVQRLARAR